MNATIIDDSHVLHMNIKPFDIPRLIANPIHTFREKIMAIENGMKKMISDGSILSNMDDCTLTHYFTPIDDKYGCYSYAREMFIPKGTIIVGKIHRHQHLNIISKGSVSVTTEHGKKFMQAPCTFISEVGLKRAVYAEEDTVWTTVHLTSGNSESELDAIEDEVIAPNYEALKDNLIGVTL